MAVKARDLSMPFDWLEVAEVLSQAGREAEALDWAERGVAAFPDRSDGRLDEFLCDAYHEAGRQAEAVDLAWRRFVARPELTTYQRLAAHATTAGEWAERRPQAIAVLREQIETQPSAPRAGSGRSWGRPVEPPGALHLVEVLLWEGDTAGAWEEAVKAGVPHRLWMRLAAAREGDHPDDVVPIYQREVERLIDMKTNGGYRDAVGAMVRVGDLLARAGRAEEFPTYVSRVRAAHKPKRNLMKLFDGKSW